MRCLVLVSVLVCACSSGAGQGESRHNIVGGTITSAFPAVVGVLVSNGGYCTGTLIAPNVVLTAAHCVSDFVEANTPTASEVAFGDGAGLWDAQIGTIDMIMERRYAPPAFNKFDIALVRMASPAPDGVTPRNFNRRPLDDNYIGLPINVVGFGLGGDGEPAGIKRWMSTTVDDITYYHVIFGDPNFNTCSGDSGGPTFADIDGEEVVIGVTSFGRGGCMGTSNMTRTDTYQGLLDQVVNAWSGPCPADGFCDEGCVAEDPDCDPCRFEGTCAVGCENVDLDCPIGALNAEACGDRFDCESRVCVTAPDDQRIKFCSQECDPQDPGACITPLAACREVDGANVCVYAGPTASAQGAGCDGAEDCRSGNCDAEQRICVEPCTDSCVDGYSCQNGFCRLSESGGGCAVTGRGTTPWIALLMLLSLFGCRRKGTLEGHARD
jgi:V8-like Glu-specific endopeptidase